MAAFAPILGVAPTVLVLGSMPSEISLKEQQYYANPRNAFWWIMSELYEFDLALDYHGRCLQLLESGVAVWDVLYDCQREGSLDSAIVRSTAVPNDFASFFCSYPSVNRLLFNGAAAESLFRRHHSNLIEELEDTRPGFKWSRCPSTSPAYASMNRSVKLEAWQSSVS